MNNDRSHVAEGRSPRSGNCRGIASSACRCCYHCARYRCRVPVPEVCLATQAAWRHVSVADQGGRRAAGVSDHRARHRLGRRRQECGRVGWRSIVYFEVVSTIALMVGLLAGQPVLADRQGHDVLSPPAQYRRQYAKAAPQGFLEFMMHIVPDNFVGAFEGRTAAGGGAGRHGRHRHPGDSGTAARADQRGLDYISEVLFSFINLVMKLARSAPSARSPTRWAATALLCWSRLPNWC
jgi:hypothetical protein